MTKQIASSILVVCLVLLGGGCRKTSTQIERTTPIMKSYKKVSIELRNCNGKGDLKQSLASTTQASQQIEISDQAVSTTTGETAALPSDVKVLLIDEVRRSFLREFSEAQSTVEQTVLIVSLGRIRTFHIYSQENTYSSTINFEMDSQSYNVAYTYQLTIPYVNDQWETSCTA